MKIATWNVNSIKARHDNAKRYLEEFAPDVICLQEIKCIDENFPAETFEDLGYNVAVHGQKTYNGVALLSKRPMEDILVGLPGDESDEQARFIEATITTDGAPIRIASLYLPMAIRLIRRSILTSWPGWNGSSIMPRGSLKPRSPSYWLVTIMSFRRRMMFGMPMPGGAMPSFVRKLMTSSAV